MGQIQNVFQRMEKKYLMTEPQFQMLLNRLQEYMQIDEYGLHTICNIYFDTEDFALIRRSLEKPVYKEKFRVRSYGVPKEQDTVFAEIKKKYDGIVYKRRIALPEREARSYLLNGQQPQTEGQILREINWLLQYYKPIPKVFIAYDRIALFGMENPELRLTFDRNIRFRTLRLELAAGDWGTPLLPEGEVLMEVKIQGAAPLWLSHMLSEQQLYSTSFSKYGFCYRQHLLHPAAEKGEMVCA